MKQQYCFKKHKISTSFVECESVRSGTPIKLDDVSGYGTADSCSDKTPPYLPTIRNQQQQPFDTICRDEVRNEFSMGTRPMRVSRRTIMLQYNRLFLLDWL